MATKAQIARRLYGIALSELTPGQRAAVTRKYNEQNRDIEFESYGGSNNGKVSVTFGRPSFTARTTSVPVGTSVGDALKLAKININPDKEGVIEKESGATVMFNDTVQAGMVYVIAPGIDSQ